MVQLSKESITEWKKIFEEEYGAKYTDEEASEAAHNLVNFFYLLLKIDQRTKKKRNSAKTIVSSSGGVNLLYISR